jgi:hypothetical protein
MASSYADKGYYDLPETPERGLERIQAERRRKGVIAAVLFAAAVIVTFGFVYLAYSDAPAPSDPANAEPAVPAPYR